MAKNEKKIDTLDEYEARHRTDEARGREKETPDEAQKRHEESKEPPLKETTFGDNMIRSTSDWSFENMSTGGGQPIEKGHRRTTQERVMQPRDTDGRFDYNSAAGLARKYPYHGERNGSAEKGWGNKQKVPMFARATKINFIIDENGNEAIAKGTVFSTDHGERFEVCETITRQEFEGMLQDYWVDRKGYGHLGNDVVFMNMSGRRRGQDTYVMDTSKQSAKKQAEIGARSDEFLDQADIVGPRGGKHGRDDYKYRNMDLTLTSKAMANAQPWLSGEKRKKERLYDTIHNHYGANAYADAQDSIARGQSVYGDDVERVIDAAKKNFFGHQQYRRLLDDVTKAIEESKNENLKKAFSQNGSIENQVMEELYQAALGQHKNVKIGDKVIYSPDIFEELEFLMYKATGKPFEDKDVANMLNQDGVTHVFDTSRAKKRGPQGKKKTAFIREKVYATPSGRPTKPVRVERKDGGDMDYTGYSSSGTLIDQHDMKRGTMESAVSRNAAMDAFDRFVNGKVDERTKPIVKYLVDKYGVPTSYDKKSSAEEKREAKRQQRVFRAMFIKLYEKWYGKDEWNKLTPVQKQTFLDMESDKDPLAQEYLEQFYGLKPRDTEKFTKKTKGIS